MLDAGLFDLAAPSPITRTLKSLRRAVSPQFGIVTEVVRRLRYPDEVALPSVHAISRADFGPAPDGESTLTAADEDASLVTGTGQYPNADRAFAAAVAESLERYSAAYVPPEALVFASFEALDERAIQPKELRFFSAEQFATPDFPFQQLDESTPVRWCRGVHLPTLEPILGPAQLMYFSTRTFKSKVPAEPLLAPVTSNGLACGATPTEAALAAIFELLERDAAMITWYNGLSLPTLDWESDESCCRFYEAHFANCGVEMRAIDLSAFHGVPIVLAAVRGKLDRYEPLTIGGSAGRTAAEAWEKAFAEALGLRRWIRDIRPEAIASMQAADSSEIDTFQDRIAFYCHAANVERAAFVDASADRQAIGDVPSTPSGSPGDQLRWLTEKLAAQGTDVYLFDVTSPDVADLGLTVVRAFSPSLVPLHAEETFRAEAVPRLATAPAALGLRGEPHRLPHPYP